MPSLDQWFLVAQPSNDVYQPPHQIAKGIRDTDGKMVRTSEIVAVQGNVITTQSGTEYTLLNPAPKYVEWCRERGSHIPTREQPLPPR